ncbi:MAG: hypothetical protein JSS32_07345 [Verrucomicrobia bacterium]|nr:hypothetical protein [Verrucomicrobiota bacterium]
MTSQIRPSSDEILNSHCAILNYQRRIDSLKVNGVLIPLRPIVQKIMDATNSSIQNYLIVLDSFRNPDASAIKYPVAFYSLVQQVVLNNIQSVDEALRTVHQEVEQELAWRKAASAVRKLR